MTSWQTHAQTLQGIMKGGYNWRFTCLSWKFNINVIIKCKWVLTLNVPVPYVDIQDPILVNTVNTVSADVPATDSERPSAGLIAIKLDLGPFHEWFFHWNSNLKENSFWSHPSCGEVIAMKFCTGHDSCAVLACAKFCSNIIPYNGVTFKIFHQNLHYNGKIIPEMGPSFLQSFW